MTSSIVAAWWAQTGQPRVYPEWITITEAIELTGRAKSTIQYWGSEEAVERRWINATRCLYNRDQLIEISNGGRLHRHVPGRARCTRCTAAMEFRGLCYECWLELRGMAPWQMWREERDW